MNLFIIPTDTCYGLGCPINDLHWYQRIYEIKWRWYDKPLAIVVYDINYLRDNTNLTDKQIEFIKNYKYPFTILSTTRQDILPDVSNKSLYEKLAFRIAETNLQKKLIEKYGPIFLTSANFSGEKEIYTIKDLKEKFSQYNDIEILSTEDLSESKPSDIFEFVEDSLEFRYLRRNYN